MATTDPLSEMPEAMEAYAEPRFYSGDYKPLQRRGRGDYRIYLIPLQRASFIIAAFLLLSIAVWSNWQSENWQSPPRDNIRSEDLNLSVRNARYAGLDAGKLPFSITADEIIQDKARPDELTMVAPKADILLNNGGWLYMWAENAVIENTSNRLFLNDNVNIHFSEGYELHTQEARLNMRLGIILGDQPVKAQGVDANFSGSGFRIHNSGRNIALLGPADLQLSHSQEPIYIHADTALEWHSSEDKYSAEKNVAIRNGSFALNAHKLEVFYRKDKDNRQEVELIKAYGAVKFNSADNIIHADQAIYDVSSKLVRFAGKNLRMDSQGIRLTADKFIEYRSDSEIAIAHGNAEAKSADSKSLAADTIRAKIAWVKGEKQISYLTANKNVFVDTGQVKISGNDGHYDFIADKGKICGNLQVIQDGNKFGGECAGIDLKSGVSYVDGNFDGDSPVNGSDGQTDGQGRVHGIFTND